METAESNIKRTDEQQRLESGQAILEYILLLAIIISISGIMISSVRGMRDRMWKQTLCQVSSICAGCQPPESIQRALPEAGNCKK